MIVVSTMLGYFGKMLTILKKGAGGLSQRTIFHPSTCRSVSWNFAWINTWWFFWFCHTLSTVGQFAVLAALTYLALVAHRLPWGSRHITFTFRIHQGSQDDLQNPLLLPYQPTRHTQPPDLIIWPTYLSYPLVLPTCNTYLTYPPDIQLRKRSFGILAMFFTLCVFINPVIQFRSFLRNGRFWVI